MEAHGSRKQCHFRQFGEAVMLIHRRVFKRCFEEVYDWMKFGMHGEVSVWFTVEIRTLRMGLWAK